MILIQFPVRQNTLFFHLKGGNLVIGRPLSGHILIKGISVAVITASKAAVNETNYVDASMAEVNETTRARMPGNQLLNLLSMEEFSELDGSYLASPKNKQ